MKYLSRRSFLRDSTIVTAGLFAGSHMTAADRPSDTGKILTVSGPIQPNQLGFCLPHEHVLSRFGAEPAEPPIYDTEAAVREVVPYLDYLGELGVSAIADCTAQNFGRAPGLLRRLAMESGLHLITNTGFYGAADDRYIPARAYELKVEGIARLWIDDFEKGIGDTGVRPGFVKTAVDSGPLSEIDGKLVRAAALTHLATGLTLAVHTGNNPEAAEQQLAILEEEGVAPRAWTWTHAQNVPDPAPLLEAAERGAWISLDAIKLPYYQEGEKQGRDTLERHLMHLLALREAGHLDRVLLSHDGSTFPPGGKGKRPMDFLSNTFLPLLKASGLTEEEIDKLTVTNPAQYFTVQKRLV